VCLLATVLSACTADGVSVGTEAARGGAGGWRRARGDAGAGDARPEAALCTLTPDQWLATCDGDEPRTCGRGHGRDARGHDGRHACDRGPSERECEELASSDEWTRERAALTINLRVHGDALGELHFSHGYRRDETVYALLDACWSRDEDRDDRHDEDRDDRHDEDRDDRHDEDRDDRHDEDRDDRHDEDRDDGHDEDRDDRHDEDRGSPASRTSLEDLRDANRAFAACTDQGILVPWVATPVCGDDGRGPGSGPVSGPVENRCLAFDTGCTRGRYDAAAGCCAISAMAAGTLCGEPGDGELCDGGGRCVPAASVPEAARTNDPFDWLHIYSSGVPELGLHPTEVAVTPSTDAPHPGLSGELIEVWAPVDPARVELGFKVGVDLPEPGVEQPAIEPYDADLLAILPASLAGSQRVTILRSASTSPVRAIAYAGPRVPHALVLPLPAGTSTPQVWAVRGELDRLPAVHPDGSTAGAILLDCQPIDAALPAAAPTGPQCVMTETEAIVVGLDLALVWLPVVPGDIVLIGGSLLGCRPIGTPGFGCRGDARPQPSGGLPRDRLCETRACAAGACGGVRLCFQGRLGACITTTGPGGASVAEACDGTDNDCDGTVDEGGLADCNDGIPCTVDACGIGGCSNIGAASLCADTDGASCTVAVCTEPSGRSRTARRLPAGDTAGLGPGCAVVAANNWCTDVWDSCNCNGPEVCAPGAMGAAPGIGCVPAPAGTIDPCDRDGAFCTVESLCCEPEDGGFCLVTAGLPRTTLAAREALCAGGSTATWPATAPTTGPPVGPVPVRCSAPLPPGIPRCRDFNPCTSDLCLAGGCMNTMLVGVTRPAESISTPLGSVSGPSCVGETPFPFGCANMVCGGTVIDTGGAVPGRPGVCGEQPASFGLYPVGTNTASCTPEPTPDLCGVYQCNGAGRCLPAQRPGLPPGGRTTECGFLPRDAPPETDCIHDGCVNGACVRDYADSSMCSRPGDAGCLNPWVCDGSRLYTFDDPDVLAGCRPSGDCYLGGGAGGGLDGECFASGSSPRLQDCLFCDALGAPYQWSFRPAGTRCEDTNDCTSGDSCGSTGVCEPGACDRGRPECDDEFCGAAG
jgi:hypothetical protein